MKKKLVVLTGAGISAESGIATFRDAGGLWEGHKIEDVASPDGWRRNRSLVLEFYNLRRKAALEAKPNAAHHFLAAMEEWIDVTIVTQNVDNLHERAGSSHVVHLHGELFKSRSTADPSLVYDMDGWELKEGDRCEKGSQLRPHIVWFGEAVPMIDMAIGLASQADYFWVVGTSLQVYPAASLVHYVSEEIPKWYIDPKAELISGVRSLVCLAEPATLGVPRAAEQLMQLLQNQ
jgi:NAD-dependent deacetylase